jgi:hypothetical protein
MQELFTQTVFQIKSENTFPQFNLYPQAHIESVMNNLPSKEGRDKLLGTAGIRLPNHPHFRDLYKLMGIDTHKLQRMFDNDAVLDALMQLNAKPYEGLICVEGKGQHIFIYPLYQRIPVRSLKVFLDKVVKLAIVINSTANQ